MGGRSVYLTLHRDKFSRSFSSCFYFSDTKPAARLTPWRCWGLMSGSLRAGVCPLCQVTSSLTRSQHQPRPEGGLRGPGDQLEVRPRTWGHRWPLTPTQPTPRLYPGRGRRSLKVACLRSLMCFILSPVTLNQNPLSKLSDPWSETGTLSGHTGSFRHSRQPHHYSHDNPYYQPRSSEKSEHSFR